MLRCRKCVLLLSLSAAVVLLFTQQFSALQLDTSQCGQTKRCEFGGCPGAAKNDPLSCHYAFAVGTESANTVQMELYAKRSSPEERYVAVGFSEDQLMGEDSVTYCVLSPDGRVEAHLAVNNPQDKSNQVAPPGAEQGTLELLEGRADDHGIYCKIRQHSNGSPQRDLVKPNLQKPFYVLLAKGAAADARTLSIHSLEPDTPPFPHISSAQMVPLDPRMVAAPPAQSAGGGLSLVDFHGILMTVAWLALTSVAVYSARFMRSAWPNSTFMGLKIWFHIHRTLNVLSVLAMVVSSVMIVYSKGRWTGPWFDSAKVGLGGWHSLAGALAVFLSLTQPFGALLRCGVDHPKRPIFNWVHRTAGLVAMLLGSIAMFIAVYKFKKHFALADFALWLLIFFFAALFLVVVASEVLRCSEAKEHQKMTAIEMQTRTRGSQTPSDAYYYHTRKNSGSRVVSLRKVFFAVAVSLCVGTSLLLVLLILLQ